MCVVLVFVLFLHFMLFQAVFAVAEDHCLV